LGHLTSDMQTLITQTDFLGLSLDLLPITGEGIHTSWELKLTKGTTL